MQLECDKVKAEEGKSFEKWKGANIIEVRAIINIVTVCY